MDFYEAQELAQNMYPGKKVDFSFDMDCLREMNFVYTNGKCNDVCHAAYTKVNILVDGEKKHQFPIAPHRMNFHSVDMAKELSQNINGK